ncbi:hypothetical protein [Pontibacter chitinilyticus]|uniref:hypothetical protein n=1 Tax=Pontibacter chitinilyticus TaxID=2674989 RepID=UPI00321A4EB5
MKTLLEGINFVDLRTGFILTGFADFESAFAASEELCGKGFKVIYLNEASFVRECEAVVYTRCFDAADARQFQNYHHTSITQAKSDARESLQTALEVLEEKNQYKARFIMVLALQKVKSQKLQKNTQRAAIR